MINSNYRSLTLKRGVVYSQNAPKQPPSPPPAKKNVKTQWSLMGVGANKTRTTEVLLQVEVLKENLLCTFSKYEK